MSKINIDEILDRVKLALNVRSDIELSKKLDKSPTYIGQCRKRKSADFDLLFEILSGYNFDWLVTGEKNMIKSIAEIDSKGNRVELTSVSKVSDPHNYRSPLMDYKTGMENLLNSPTIGTESETALQKKDRVIEEKDSIIRDLMKQLYSTQQLVAEYQLREK